MHSTCMYTFQFLNQLPKYLGQMSLENPTVRLRSLYLYVLHAFKVEK
jgi:hypothetical protein